MEAKKSITLRLFGLTARKRQLLGEVLSTWRSMIKEKKTYKELRETHPEVSALYARNASYKRSSPNDPVYLASYDFKLIDAGKKFAHWFIRIPIRKGAAVFAPLRLRKDEYLNGYKIHDSKLVEQNSEFYLHLNVSKEVPHAYAPRGVLAVDFGERRLATAVLLLGDKASSEASKPTPRFYGKRVRGIRRHYAWLRRRLGERKLLRILKRIGRTEQRKVDWHLHNISRWIIEWAKQSNAVILLGDLTGIRNRARGRRMNRIVANMPYYRLGKFIEYKAAFDGVPVVYGSEAYTSRTCHLCHGDGRRTSQGTFRCPSCQHEYQADYNAAYNQAERLRGYIFRSGAFGSTLMSGTSTDTASLNRPPTLS